MTADEYVVESLTGKRLYAVLFRQDILLSFTWLCILTMKLPPVEMTVVSRPVLDKVMLPMLDSPAIMLIQW